MKKIFERYWHWLLLLLVGAGFFIEILKYDRSAEATVAFIFYSVGFFGLLILNGLYEGIRRKKKQ